MTCRNCGREILDGSVFCPHCGTTQTPAPEGLSTPAAPAWEGPEGGGKKKTGMLIGVGAAVVAVIALVAVFAGGLFASPKKQVEKAFVKSAAAYAQAWKKLDLPDTAQWQKDQEITQNINLSLKDIHSELTGMDLSALSGLEVGLVTSYGGADRWMFANLETVWGSDRLLDLSVKADDAELYFNSPQLTGDTHYGVNTETLGADLAELTGDYSMEDLSFNLFDLVELAQEKMDQEQLKQDITAANKSLWDQAQVKKTGSKTLSVNGTDTKTTAYQVTIPQGALNRYAGDLKTALSALNYSELYEEMFRSMGMPREEIQDFLDQLENVDPYGPLADGLREAVDELGDLTLNVFLSDGYVSAVEYENYLFEDDAHVKISVFLGGGEEYVDDLRLEIKVDDQFIIVDSEGDHSLKSGAFTDETVIKGPFPRINSSLSLNPGDPAASFRWTLAADDSGQLFALDMTGDMDWSRDYLFLDLDEVSVRALGIEVCTLAFSYHAENCDTRVAVEDPQIITRMSQEELTAAALDVQSRAEAWDSEMQELFVSRLGRELIWWLMGGGVHY